MSELIDKLKEPAVSQFQEELAKTYFSTTPPKESYPTRPHTPVKNKKPKQVFLPALLILVGMFIAALFIFNRLEIIVKILPTAKDSLVGDAESQDRIYLNKNGEPDRGLIKDIMFYENADISSGWKNGFAILSSEVNSKRAKLGISFNSPVDMVEDLFCFYAKGKTGAEEIRLVLRDANNRLCYSAINRLQNSWQRFMIDVGQAGDFVDSRSITHIDFELNPEEKQEMARPTAYFKDLYFTKRRQ